MSQHEFVPLVDISGYRDGTATTQKQVAEQVSRACDRSGFLVIAGHGVPPSLIQAMRTASTEFFESPLSKKMPFNRPDNTVGYHQSGTLATGRSRNASAAPDLRENFLVGPTWPADERVWPTSPRWFGSVADAYRLAMEDLCDTMMKIFATILELPETYFTDRTNMRQNTLSLTYYHGQNESTTPGIAPHSDYGALTILHKQAGVKGLQVQEPDGQWLNVVPLQDTFILNIGDLMAQWTNDRWVSTVHRVFGQDTPEPGVGNTLSVVYFQSPNYNTIIEPIPSCVGPDNPPRYDAVSAGEYFDGKLSKVILE